MQQPYPQVRERVPQDVPCSYDARYRNTQQSVDWLTLQGQCADMYVYSPLPLYTGFFFSSYATQKRILQPVIQHIQSNPSAKRLVHALSNGGACQFAALAEFLHQEKVNDGSPAISPTSIIFDSCPGCTDLGPALKAFTMGMPAVARYPTYMLLTGLWLSLFCYDKLIATEPGHILKMRRDLNNLEYISKGMQGGSEPWLD